MKDNEGRKKLQRRERGFKCHASCSELNCSSRPGRATLFQLGSWWWQLGGQLWPPQWWSLVRGLACAQLCPLHSLTDYSVHGPTHTHCNPTHTPNHHTQCSSYSDGEAVGVAGGGGGGVGGLAGGGAGGPARMTPVAAWTSRPS